MADVNVSVEPVSETSEEVTELEWASLVLEVRDSLSNALTEMRQANQRSETAERTTAEVMTLLRELVTTQQSTITQLTNQLANNQGETSSLIRELLTPPVVVEETPPSENEDDLEEVVIAEEVLPAKEPQIPARPKRRSL